MKSSPTPAGVKVPPPPPRFTINSKDNSNEDKLEESKVKRPLPPPPVPSRPVPKFSSPKPPPPKNNNNNNNRSGSIVAITNAKDKLASILSNAAPALRSSYRKKPYSANKRRAGAGGSAVPPPPPALGTGAGGVGAGGAVNGNKKGLPKLGNESSNNSKKWNNSYKNEKKENVNEAERKENGNNNNNNGKKKESTETDGTVISKKVDKLGISRANKNVRNIVQMLETRMRSGSNRSNRSNKSKNHGRGDSGASIRSRRIFDDMNSDESDVSEFEVLVTDETQRHSKAKRLKKGNMNSHTHHHHNNINRGEITNTAVMVQQQPQQTHEPGSQRQGQMTGQPQTGAMQAGLQGGQQQQQQIGLHTAMEINGSPARYSGIIPPPPPLFDGRDSYTYNQQTPAQMADIVINDDDDDDDDDIEIDDGLPLPPLKLEEKISYTDPNNPNIIDMLQDAGMSTMQPRNDYMDFGLGYQPPAQPQVFSGHPNGLKQVSLPSEQRHSNHYARQQQQQLQLQQQLQQQQGVVNNGGGHRMTAGGPSMHKKKKRNKQKRKDNNEAREAAKSKPMMQRFLELASSPRNFLTTQQNFNQHGNQMKTPQLVDDQSRTMEQSQSNSRSIEPSQSGNGNFLYGSPYGMPGPGGANGVGGTGYALPRPSGSNIQINLNGAHQLGMMTPSYSNQMYHEHSVSAQNNLYVNNNNNNQSGNNNNNNNGGLYVNHSGQNSSGHSSSRSSGKIPHSFSSSVQYFTQDMAKIKSPLYYNQNSKADNIIVSKFPHARPIPGTKYFQAQKGLKGGLSVVIPFFNETATELEITLKTLYYSWQYLCFRSPKWERRPFNVCIIQDGWYKADESMKRYLKKMFPKKYANASANHSMNGSSGHNSERKEKEESGSNSNGDSKFWWDFHDEFIKYDQSKQGSTTFIIEKTVDNPTFFQIRFKDRENEELKKPRYQLKMHLTLIIKIDNRRKHNSHEWFMGKDAFADATNSKYFLATDAFTIFDKRCLFHLVDYMETHPNCCACTGRQRAMSRRQQGLREREWTMSMDYILRQTQRCDFELSTCVYNPAFSMLGFLPVIPGPCGMYRCEDALTDEARDWYFNVINASPSETGLVLGNLRIAEDRVLSYASILKLKTTRFMAYIDEAMFYFEAETNLDTFLYQRRRWINGTFAGYWFLLISNPSHFWQWNASYLRKWCVWVLLWICLLQMVGIMISPAISFTILEQGLGFLLKTATYPHTDSVDTLMSIIMGIVWTVWVAHVIVHNREKFHPIIMQFLYFLSALTSLCFLASYIILFAVEKKTIHDALTIDGMTDELLTGILILMATAAIAPVITNFLISADFHGVWVLIKSFFAYFISFHMMIPWFSSYSFARCWDLSWGNRPASSEGEDGGGSGNDMESDTDLIGGKVDIADLMKAKFLQFSRLVALWLIVVNFGVYFMPLFWKAMIMSGLLLTGVLFMVLSLVVLIFRFPGKLYQRYVKPLIWTVCCWYCRRKSRKRAALAALQAGK